MWSYIWRGCVFVILIIFSFALCGDEYTGEISPLCRFVAFIVIGILWIYIALSYFSHQFGPINLM